MCQREEPRALYAADSLSRQIAQTLPPDTLALVWASDAMPGDAEALELEYPRTVAFGPGGLLYATDARAGALLAFDPATGALEERWSPEVLDTPYLAGFRGDTAYVFAPNQRRLDALSLASGEVARSVELPDPEERDVLQYAAVSDEALYYKAVLPDNGSFVARLGGDGEVRERRALDGPNWWHAGFLRVWGDTLVSLNGYGTTARLLPASLRGTLSPDTLALVGFDSPMLARSRGFALGSVKRPPVLSSSAAPLGDRLFVLNMRPGWLQIDVFGKDGRLQAILTEPSPGFRKSFFPVDLAVREVGEGRYEIGVVEVEPIPRVVLYRWTPSDPAALPPGVEAAQ